MENYSMELVDWITRQQEANSQSAFQNDSGQEKSSQGTSDPAVSVLNKAIILFQQHKYLSAVGLLEPLYSQIDSLDAGTAIRVCFLLIDIYLGFRQLSQANGIINYLHQALPVIVQSLSLQQASSLPAPITSNPQPQTQRASTLAKPDTAAPHPKNGSAQPHQGPRSISPMSATDNCALPTAKCSTPKLGVAGLMSHPVSVSQGPSPNTSITSQSQTGAGRDVKLDHGNGRYLAPVGFTGYVAALGVDLPAGCSDEGVDDDGKCEPSSTGVGCRPGPTALCLPYLSQLTGAIVQRAQQLQNGAMDELGRWEVDVKVALRVYKAQLHLLSNNTKAAKRELKSAAAVGASKQLTALMRAQLEMCRGNFTKASRMLVALVQDVDAFTSSPLQLLNNLGVLHHHLGQHQTAALYFSKALQQNSRQLEPRQGKSRPTVPPPMDLSAALLYNAGLQQMMVKNYMLALKCFRRASYCFHHQPLLWLRLAECAVAVAGNLQVPLQNAPAAQEAATDDTSASGSQRFSEALSAAGLTSLLDASCATDTGVVDALDPQEQVWAGLHDTSTGRESFLQYAQNCLDVSLVLLDTSHHEPFAPDAQSPHMSAGRSVGSIDAALDSPRDASNGLGSPHPNGKQGDPSEDPDVVRAAVLALSSYISLQQEQYSAALASAKSLLKLHNLSPHNHFLGVCYAAEALCHTGMTNDAMELLNQNLDSIGEVAEPGNQSRPPLGNAGELELLTGDKARSVMYTNMAAVYIAQGDFAAAAHCAEQANSLCSSPRSNLLLVYLALARGDTSAALDMLKSTTSVDR